MRRRVSTALMDSAGAEQASLADLDAALEKNATLSPTRRRDLRSAARRVARLIGEESAQIPLDLAALRRRLAACLPAAAGITDKSFANIKSGFLAAVKASGIKSVHRAAMTASWRKLMAELSSKRMHLGLSRFARWCSGKGIEPGQVSDVVLADFIDAVRQGTLHRKPNELHRNVALNWNEAAKTCDLALQRLTVPSFRRPTRRLDWSLLPDSFRSDLDAYLNWCGGSDAFATNARSRTLAPQTIKQQQDHVHAAATALVKSGVPPQAIASLGELLTVDNFRRILRQRHEMVSGGENVFNRDLARTLVEVARRWVKVDEAVLEELKRLARKVPAPLPGLTNKNKTAVRQFDDPANLRRLVELPERLWAEVKRDNKPSFRTVLKAQAALAIGTLCYMPIRPQNLWTLGFGEHIFLHEGRGAISSLEIPAGEVKNRTELAFDIPTHLAKMLIEYRNRLVPKVIGRRPERLFIKADGAAKNQWAVSRLIRTVLRRRTGLRLSPHQFRHLGAKVALDAEPGNFETVKQLLGHKSLDTTVSAYAGISSRRAARHHQHLLEQALGLQQPKRGR
jgi:integrase